MDDLRRSLEKWVAAGLITREQADAILRSEERVARTEEPRVSRLAEVLGYLGGVLVLAAAATIVASSWSDLSAGARLALFAVATLALAIGGWRAGDAHEPAARRLGSLLWFLSAGSFAGVLAEFGREGIRVSSEGSFVLAASGTAVYAGLLWVARPSALQQLAMFASGAVALVAAVLFADIQPSSIAGLPLWGLGVVWITLARLGTIKPQRTAYALGALAALIGPQVMFDSVRDLGVVLGLVTSAGLMAASIPFRETALLGLGAAGMFAFVPQALERYFGDTLGVPVLLFISGILLVGVAVAVTRLRNLPGARTTKVKS